ncbi:MAG: phosphoglucosamine mutase [Proteobacteria bacterium]|jgi:phosphoglucosamine mutase|nr:phosphoglucosamine mutase [Pseudomonadota bacterium]
MKLFGTDGIRGRTNVEPMTVETMLRVAKAMGYILRKNNGNKRHKVLIGKDTRLSGYMFETALESGFCSMGVDVLLVGPIPTPAIAYLTESMKADVGIVISASHNPFDDNGIKFFNEVGFKVSDQMEAEITRIVSNPHETAALHADPSEIGKAKRIEDANGRYISYLKQFLPQHLTLEGVKIVLDCANGSGYKVGPTIFSELGATVIPIGVTPDGKNINENCGAVHPEALKQKVIQEKAHIGIALDGDGDRVMFCDETGRVYDGDDFLSIIADQEKIYPEVKSGLVGTVMTNFGLEKKLKSINIPFYRSDVGDRFVVEKMKETKAMFGAEASGHIISLKRSTTGDGILSAILLLNILREQNKPLSAYYNSFDRLPHEIKNVKVREKKPFDQMPKVQQCIQDAEKKLHGKGRILVRYSGTEAKARVMVESEDQNLVQSLVAEVSSVIQNEIGA